MTTEHLIFSSPASPDTHITLNLDPVRPFILATPDRPELLAELEQYEATVIDHFWTYALHRSPYNQKLPYALSCSASGHSLIPVSSLVPLLPAGQKLTTIPMQALRSAVGQIKPKSIAQALGMMTVNGHMRLNAFSTIDLAQQHQAFEDLVVEIAKIALSTSLQKRFALNCLLAMRRKGWLLLPIRAVEKVGYLAKGMKLRNNQWAPEPLDYLSKNQQKLIKQLEGEPLTDHNEMVNARVKSRFAVLCSSISSVRDLSWPFAERILFSTGKMSRKGANGIASPMIRSRWQQLCAGNGPVGMINLAKANHRENILQRFPADPRLMDWLELLVESCNNHQAGNMEPMYQAYGHWLTWLASLPVIPAPLAVTRAHIKDPRDPKANTFHRFLDTLQVKKAKTRNTVLAKMSDVFDRLSEQAALDGRICPNPIHFRNDSFRAPRQRMRRGTHRERLEGYVMDELKKLLVVPDGKGAYQWAPGLKGISVLYLQLAGQAEPIFCPILAAIIFLMLEYPLRSHQVRWLDSGELDPLVYDYERNEFVENPHSTGDGESYGVLQPSADSRSNDTRQLDFQVAINKVMLEMRRAANFDIPYVSPQTLWVIRQVTEWQNRYGVEPVRVKEVFEPTKERNRNFELEDYYPEICPLFRYPEQHAYFPPSSQQLNYFWGQLCAQYDRIADDWTDPKTNQKRRRPDAPILSKVYRKNSVVATHDMHSLRVAGVSFLLDAGIPLAVVASVAGHYTLQMTLHYYRMDKRSLRLRLQEAYAKLGDTKTWEDLETRLEQCVNYEGWLNGTPDGFAALSAIRSKRTWIISLSGICPAAACDQGLPEEFHGTCGKAVPASRCALCRYFVYGPAFLPGLVHEFNCILFELEQKANSQHQLRMEAMEARNSGEHGRARALRGEDDRLERECLTDLKVLTRLHIMIDECIDKANRTATSDTNMGELALMLQEPGELQSRIERVGNFQRLKDLVEASEKMRCSRHTAPEQAFQLLHEKILSTLRLNGAAPFLAGLPRPFLKKLTMEFASVIEAAIPDADQREKLMAGELTLSQLPAADEAIRRQISELDAKAHQQMLPAQAKEAA